MSIERITFTTSQRWLHRIAVILAVGTVLLIAKGGLVHSAGAGLSVPDWPTTYGENMFTYPIEKWTGGIVFEHGHRLIASGIGFITIIVAVMVWFVDKRRWMKVLAGVALLSVIVQGVLGGLTVLMQLPAAVSISHAMLAQSFLLMTVAMAAATSRAWMTGSAAQRVNAGASVQRLLLAAVLLTFVQIFLGALTRHTYSAPFIPDFPLSNGRIIPVFTDSHVVIHFAHRVGALVVTIAIFWAGIVVLRARELARLRTAVITAMLLVLVQATLGATVIWTRQAILPNTLHVAFGALTFATIFLAWLRAARWYRFSETQPSGVAGVEGARA
ncbi:MAG: heme A synthase [Ignavibacteriae bacterium]|nr:heme A synthase [Ignavibacteriota bacterium]